MRRPNSVQAVYTGILMQVPFISFATYFGLYPLMAGLVLEMLGGVCNFAVMLSNNSKMPVFRDGHDDRLNDSESQHYTFVSESTSLVWLCDRIDIFSGKSSIGDILSKIGLAWSLTVYFCYMVVIWW